jgi:para-aminobenzoate synthetase component I
VNRVSISFPVTDFFKTKYQMLNWARQFSIFCFLDNHAYQQPFHDHECLLAAGSIGDVESSAGHAFEDLRQFSASAGDWIFGHFSYDLKNETDSLHSHNPDSIIFPDLFFFIPEILLELNNGSLKIGMHGNDHYRILDEILGQPDTFQRDYRETGIKERISHKDYIESIKKIQKHIAYGDCYELNFCQEFYAENSVLDPWYTYSLLSANSPMPFGAFYKHKDQFLLCASPERFLKKKGNIILSQPIKGTASRIPEHALLDEIEKSKLYHSAKERSENIMIVDLVRNDLSRISSEGSVRVNELYGIYSFPHVHQMISTISGNLAEGIAWSDAIRLTFPMGSMTGAPKKRAMELIEEYEKTKRGIFSGAVGYCNPEKDFDFNVVIRSIMYNSSNRYLSYQVGSAITFYSEPEKEYQECLLKAAAIKKSLE